MESYLQVTQTSILFRIYALLLMLQAQVFMHSSVDVPDIVTNSHLDFNQRMEI